MGVHTVRTETAPRTRRRRRVVAAVASLGILLGSAGAGVFYVLAPDAQPSAESEIHSVVETFNDGLNQADRGKVESVVCSVLSKELVGSSGAQFAAIVRKSIEQEGRFVVDRYDEVKVSYDRAQVELTGHSVGGKLGDIGAEHPTLGLVLLEGDWKVCKVTDDPAAERQRQVGQEKLDVRAVIEDFYAAAEEADPAHMASLSCGDLRNYFSEISAEELAQRVAQTPETIRSIDEVTVTGQSARATVTVDTPDGSYVSEFALTLVGPQWKPCRLEILAL